jgi:hypothetical protein
MYGPLLHTHWLLAWVALIAVATTTFLAFSGKDLKRASLITLIAFHLQLVVGLALYLTSPTVQTALADFGAAMKDKALRFVAVEHISIMLIGVVLVTLARRSAKANKGSAKWLYLVALLLVLSRVPWERFLALPG